MWIFELSIYVGGGEKMLKEPMEAFEQMLQKKGDRLITDVHIPKEGTYRIIEMSDSEWKVRTTVDISFDKKTGQIVGQNCSDYQLIQELDYLSKLLEMNKPIDPKKVIHSNNYLSLAVKKESIISGKLSEEVLKGYYKILREPLSKYEKKIKAKQLYEKVEERLGKPDIEVLSQIETYALNHDLWEGMDLGKKNYAKVFFVFSDIQKTREYYAGENERYLIPNIYNNNIYNVESQNEILGLPNNNMGMNSKKPFLENKSRKVKVPYLLNQSEVILQTKLFDYLMGKVSQKKYHIYVDNYDKEEMEIRAYTNREVPEDVESGYYLYCQMGKNGIIIHRADVITAYTTHLDTPFYLKNYIQIPEDMAEKSKLQYNTAIENLWEIKSLLDGVFFEGKLSSNFNTEPSDLKIYNGVLKQCILGNRDTLTAWFWRGEVFRVKETIDKFSLALIRQSILEGEIWRAMRQFNLRWSLLEYLDKEWRFGKDMSKIREQLKTHINAKTYEGGEFTSDDEYSYAVGQAVSYLLYQSKSNNKKESYVNPFLNTKNPELIRRKILELYKKYNYQISHVNGGRATQLFTQIMEYPVKKINPEWIMAGFVSISLIFEKNEAEEDK